MSDFHQTDESQPKITTPPLPSHTFTSMEKSSRPDEHEVPPKLRPLRRGLLSLCVLVAGVHPVAFLFSRHSWTADLLSHFQEPAFVVTLLATVIAMAVGGKRIAIVLLMLVLFQATPLLRYRGRNPVVADPASRERVRLLMANVLFDNEMYEDLEHLIRIEKPDIVGLVEYTPRWSEGLKTLRSEFPYRMEWPKGASGLALWFKEKPKTIRPPEWLVADGHPVIHASFEFAGEERHLWLVHPRSPLNRGRLQAGNPEIDAIADTASKTGGSRIVMGDMNSTDGSAHFRDFLKVSGLRDSRLGFGRQGSWPTDMPYRIAIDHLFLSDDLAVESRRLGHMVGSDHFPLVVDLAPAAEQKPSAQSDQTSKSR